MEEALVRKSVTTHLCWRLLDQSLPSRVGLSILLISWLCGTCNRPWHIKTQFCIFCHDSHYEIKDFLLFLSPVNPTSLSIIFSRTNINLRSTTLNYLALRDDKKARWVQKLDLHDEVHKEIWFPCFMEQRHSELQRERGKKINQTSSHLISSPLDHTLLSCQYQYSTVFPGKKEW